VALQGLSGVTPGQFQLMQLLGLGGRLPHIGCSDELTPGRGDDIAAADICVSSWAEAPSHCSLLTITAQISWRSWKPDT